MKQSHRSLVLLPMVVVVLLGAACASSSDNAGQLNAQGAGPSTGTSSDGTSPNLTSTTRSSTSSNSASTANSTPSSSTSTSVKASGTDAAAAGGHAGMSMPSRLDHEPTEAQLETARNLITTTKAATSKYSDPAAAQAAGYQSIGDALTGFEHFVNLTNTENSTILDPSQPESLVYKVLPGGGRELTTVMYILPPGSTNDDVPDVAGNLTMWHDHENLCFEEGSVKIAGILVNGKCVPKGKPGTSPMLHVWVAPNKCGPFAGTDAKQMTGSCVNDPRLVTP